MADEKPRRSEQRLAEAVSSGAVVDLRTGDAAVDDPARGAEWPAARTMRAEVVAGLVTGTRAARPGPPRAVRLRGARVTGTLDLESAVLLCPLVLEGLALDLETASAGALFLTPREPPAGEVDLTNARVGIAKQWHRRRDFTVLGKAWNWLLYLTVGYRTWLAGLWPAVLVAVGTAVFAGAYPAQMRPASATVPGFQPTACTLDVMLPIVDLGQKNWFPQGTAQFWSWGLTGAGWVLTTAVVAGLTNALKRD